MSRSISWQHPAVAVRIQWVDVLRGVAIVWMTLFHASFDLSHFGWWPQNFRTDPFWTVQRSLIVGLFVLCAGAGQVLAVHGGQDWARFWRRWWRIALCALLVTAGSALMFPRSFIFFGVLHGMAVMLLVLRYTVRWGHWLWLAGALAFISPWAMVGLFAHCPPYVQAWFDGPVLNTLGWVVRKPFTEDYVPLFPWLGVMWWGAAAMHTLLHMPKAADAMRGQTPKILQPLAVLGRHSLVYYMLHQPVLIGLVWLVTMFVR